MSVQISAFISLILAFVAFIDYLENDNCGIEEELPTGKSFFCSAAFNTTNPDKPGAFICCEPNEFISFSSVPLIGAWFIAFAIAFFGGFIYSCDVCYGTAEVGKGEASTELPATQAAAY
jgi:hypothetical protein